MPRPGKRHPGSGQSAVWRPRRTLLPGQDEDEAVVTVSGTAPGVRLVVQRRCEGGVPKPPLDHTPGRIVAIPTHARRHAECKLLDQSFWTKAKSLDPRRGLHAAAVARRRPERVLLHL